MKCTSIARETSGAKERRSLSAQEREAAALLKSIWLTRVKGHKYSNQTELAEHAPESWNQGTVAQYLNAMIPLNWSALLVFADLFELTPDELRRATPPHEQDALKRHEALMARRLTG